MVAMGVDLRMKRKSKSHGITREQAREMYEAICENERHVSTTPVNAKGGFDSRRGPQMGMSSRKPSLDELDRMR